MKKTIALFLAIFATAVVFTGCVSVETTSPANLNGQDLSLQGQTAAHINVQNWGLYLFSIPLLTGSTENPGSMAFIEDTVNVESVLPVMTAKSKELKASKTLDLASQYSDFGLIFYFRSINMSGNAVR